jgi:CBS domain-containing protein
MTENPQITKVFKGHFTTSPLLTLDVSASCQQALSLMIHHRIHHLIVTENNSPIGVLTDRDIFYRFFPSKFKGANSFEAVTIGSVVRRNVPVLSSTTKLSEALEKIETFGISAILHRNPDGSWGVITETDLLVLLNKIVHEVNWRRAFLAETETTLASPILQTLIERLNQIGL